MTEILQHSLGILAIVVAVAVTYWVDSRYVYKRSPLPFSTHFIRTGFFPRRALAYNIVIAIALALFGSMRNAFPNDHGLYTSLNNIVVILLYPLLFFIAALILAVITFSIFPILEDKV